MIPEISSEYNWLQIGSVLVSLMVYHISKVFLALMYMQHKHMVYGELNIHRLLVLYQNENYNDYSTPLRHKVLNVYHKKIMLGIYLCNNSLSYLGVQHKKYPEHDTVYLSISPHESFILFALIKHTIFVVLFCQMVLKSLS